MLAFVRTKLILLSAGEHILHRNETLCALPRWSLLTRLFHLLSILNEIFNWVCSWQVPMKRMKSLHVKRFTSSIWIYRYLLFDNLEFSFVKIQAPWPWDGGRVEIFTTTSPKMQKFSLLVQYYVPNSFDSYESAECFWAN